MKRAPVRTLLWLFTTTRLFLLLVTYFGFILLTAPKYSSTPADSALFTSWNRWDALHYLYIAQHGYQHHFDLAFFPLYPTLIALIATPLGSWSYLAIGMLISNLALLGTLFVLYQLAAENGGDEVAQRTLLYLCIFPTAFFFFTVYNESLFLLLVTSTFLALRRQRWWLAGILGMLAALTRSAGILLILPYLYELWLSREKPIHAPHFFIRDLLPVVLIPVGTLIYSVYCWYLTGNPLAFAAVQEHWSRSLTWPWQGIIQACIELFWNQPFGSFYEAHVLLDLSATLGFLVLTFLGRRRLCSSYTLWTSFMLLFFLLSPSLGQPDPLISQQRFVLELFPAFLTLAMLGIQYPRLHQIVILLFPPLQATLGLLFLMNHWMV